MPDVLIPRPDVASEHAAARNEQFNSSKIMERAEAFGTQFENIYFYNVGPMGWDNVPRYPNHPHMAIRACPEGEDWVLCRGSLTHPFEEKRFDQNGNPFTVYTDGYREASRCMNPQNPGIDQDWDSPDALNVGDNLNAFGVFWSVNYPPKPEEIAAARRRMEKTFTAELEVMVAEEAKSPEGARARANRISHAAANYFGQSYSWHRSDLTRKAQDAGKVECGACGERIQPKARICAHCGAPTDPDKLEQWIAMKTRLPGRPKTEEKD